MSTSAVKAEQPPLGGGLPTRVFIVAVSVAAAVALGLLLTSTAWTDTLRQPTFWVFLALLFATEAAPLRLPSRRGDVSTTSDIFAFALMLTSGLPAAVLALVAAVAVFHTVLSRAPVKVLFNVAQLSLSLVAAGMVVAVASGTPIGAPVQLDALGVGASVLGVLTFVATNQLLLAALLAFLEGTGVRAQLIVNRDLITITLVTLLIAPLVAAAAQVNILLMALLLVPMVAVHRTMALYLAREQMLRNQKLEALGRLSGGVAHDFNNLLAVMLGNAELLAQDNTDPLQAARIEELRSAGRRGAALADQILSFTRGQQAELVPIDVRAIVHGLIPMLTTLVGPTVGLDIRTDGGDPWVRGTATELEQIIVNLVINARDAMPSGGTLTLSVDLKDRQVLIRVADTGIGMGEDTRARAFEPFYTTKGLGRGTGLGLSTVYGIVSAWGGEVSIDSEPTRGTTMTISLPATDPVAVPDSPGPRDLPAVDAPATGTVLVVEDQDPLREIVVGVLQRSGYAVLSAADPETALELAAHAGRIDLLLTDLSMPGMTGTELATRLRAVRPEIAVLCMTGFAPGTGEELEGFAVIQKPFGLAELDERVRAMLGSA